MNENIFENMPKALLDTDPEFYNIFKNFTENDAENIISLDDKTRAMATLAALIGCQGTEEYKCFLSGVLNKAVDPIEIKEIVYQAVAYLGIGRVLPFFGITNDVIKEAGLSLPLPGQATANNETRLQAGNQAQVDIFGDGMKDFHKSGPKESRHINLWLAENCFGDYYTRGGLDLPTRELLTFITLLSLGGCEPQLKAHIAANAKLGNDKELLLAALTQVLPYIGYPRTLNAISCLNEVLPEA